MSSYISGVDIKSLPTHNSIIEQKFQQQQFVQTRKEESLHEQSITSRCVTYSKSQSQEHLSCNQSTLNEEETSKGDAAATINRIFSFRRARSLDGGGSPSCNSSVISSASRKKDDSHCSGGDIGQVKFYSHNDVMMSISKQRQFGSPSESAPYSRMSAESGEYNICSISPREVERHSHGIFYVPPKNDMNQISRNIFHYICFEK